MKHTFIYIHTLIIDKPTRVIIHPVHAAERERGMTAAYQRTAQIDLRKLDLVQ